jgi:hypothetical protein
MPPVKAFMQNKLDETYSFNFKFVYKRSTNLFIQVENLTNRLLSIFEDSGSISRK